MISNHKMYLNKGRVDMHQAVKKRISMSDCCFSILRNITRTTLKSQNQDFFLMMRVLRAFTEKNLVNFCLISISIP